MGKMTAALLAALCAAGLAGFLWLGRMGSPEITMVTDDVSLPAPANVFPNAPAGQLPILPALPAAGM